MWKRSRILLGILLFFISWSNYAQLRLISWNIENLGGSKSAAEIGFIAEIISGADVVALQEVVAGPAGPEAVGRLAKELNRFGEKWGYMVSAATSGNPHNRERYAYLWRKEIISKEGNGWLDNHISSIIDREPYMATFIYRGKPFTLVTFHATTKKNNPESEIKYLKELVRLYPERNLIFTGDFNLPQSHTVFNPLRKQGWLPAFSGQKTSLRQKCIGSDCLASEFDNIWFRSSKFKMRSAAAVHFYTAFSSIKEARMISDHIPVSAVFEFL